MMDWDDAYQNGKYIADADGYLAMWEAASATFRDGLSPEQKQTGEPYGSDPREVFDLFRPKGPVKGVVVFIHGGYWQSLDHRYWSHLAAGPMANGWAVAMPGYRLCPEVSIATITKSMVQAIAAIGSWVKGEIVICGHSAGGHLTARMACNNIPLPHVGRVRRFVSISGVHDLRPLTRTNLNEALRLDIADAAAQSPALMTPRKGIELLAWVGADERPEFLRQNDLLANIWRGAFADTSVVHAKGHHHFSVIGELAQKDSPLTTALIS